MSRLPCIVPIVEGQADREAIPLLLRRIIWEILPPPAPPIEVAKANIVDGCRLFGYAPGKPFAPDVEEAIRFAAFRAGERGLVLIVADTDGVCPVSAAPGLQARFQSIVPRTPVAVVLMHPEFEELFKYSREELAGRHQLPESLPSIMVRTADEVDGENLRQRGSPRRPVTESKGWLDNCLPNGYRETLHQPKFTGLISLEKARKCASMDKLCRVVENFARSTSDA